MARSGKNETERRCALTRSVLPTRDLIRFVAGPNGAVVPDVKRVLPGRGVWIEARRHRLSEAVRKSVFSRGLKRQVTAAPDLPDQVEAILRQRVLSAVSLANKAGAVVHGFSKVDEALASGGVAVLLHASDGAADGTDKLNRKAKDLQRPAITEFTIDELSLALGRQNVVHAAGMKNPAVEALSAEMRRLARFRDVDECNYDSGGPLATRATGPTGNARPEVT